MSRSIKILILCLLFAKTGLTSSVETVTWTGVPINVVIPVGVERVIKFKHSKIQIAIPMALAGIATAESNRGVVYLRASRPFNKSRFRFREKDTGKIYAMDVTASDESGKLAPIVIVTEDDVDVSEITIEPDLPTPVPPEAQLPTNTPIEQVVQAPLPPVVHGYTTLVRFAMQQVYAPERLIESVPDIYRVSFNADVDAINIVPGAKVKARVLGQWRNADHYVTAVYLQNMSAENITLDPRQLTGRHTWKSTALMNGVLTPANTFGDATTLVAISDKKWMEGVQWLR